MTCPGCQHKNPGDAVFCQECGSRLEAACLTTASTMYRDMDMGFWLAQAEAACAGGGP